MPSALETLVKILKLEQDTGYKNTAVIGGLQSFATNWVREAHQQAKRPEHHQLVDEMVVRLEQYPAIEGLEDRHEAIRYMLGRIMGRIPAPPDLPPSQYAETPAPAPVVEPSPPEAPPAPEPAPVRAEAPPSPAPQRTPQPKRTSAPPRPKPAPRVTDEEDDENDGGGFGDDENDDWFATSGPSDWKPPVPEPVSRPASRAPRRPHREALSFEEVETRLKEMRTPVTALHKVGDKMADKLGRLGIATIQDMLYTLPRRYDDYREMRTLNHVSPGEHITVVAAVRSVTKKEGRGKRPYLLVLLDDGTGTIQVTFFGQPWLQRQFRRGSQLVLSGQVDLFRGQLMMTNPEWELLERDNIHTWRIVPVYPLTKGLTARTMRRMMSETVETYAPRMPDYLPVSVQDRTELADLDWALEQVHYPSSFEDLTHARARLAFDDLFLFQMTLMGNRRDWQAQPGQPLHAEDEWLNSYIAALPYPLTGAQQRSLSDIRMDLAANVPMNRLLQGDVGSGKTAVASLALAIAVRAGKQAAIMAPTSILAEQHFRSIGNFLSLAPGDEQIQVRLLTGNTNEADRQEIYAGLAEGRIHVVIGTHALIQDTVTFRDLALVVIDEQHRFGVNQRAALRSKGENPHVLVMTATPIPRTLALTIYADLDLSVIDEMPPGRTPIQTRVLQPSERERAYSFIHAQLDRGRQAYIVYPLVEASDQLEETGAATVEYERLQKQVFWRYRVGLLHGQMSPAEKEAVMAQFASGRLDVLVATSVIEVGIDVPNASVVLIENAERFGLAQLHQLRGRVGRGTHESYCLLVASSPQAAQDQRLQAMEQTNDGFKLAEIDWQLRGAGDLLGVRQSGMGQFQLAELMNPQLVELAQREARTVFAEDPNLTQPEHYLLSRRIRAALGEHADVS
ncbi:MAG TPA: ATP-dependent DNA helicase RecG [Aggregatilinea sp.]|uniref:ATP-dependent DNA helicase RecG n=1 Tax=Aggregatilinea sp. TaxID=2806333 RepID=UPI002BB31FC2|nr:ATP-dependent DNA helicase RecG [Aggregatilinea sp.]HML22196.1 ATP-dependent DNA helicase RecG [Aggregatilinea sp.]